MFWRFLCFEENSLIRFDHYTSCVWKAQKSEGISFLLKKRLTELQLSKRQIAVYNPEIETAFSGGFGENLRKSTSLFP
ncbi:hypothetical protein HQ47_08440 [Porphyromonas macacae]|uniref:Uncharacterized protein n=1 Tax=Porphyromonas macacae TaxID=28115 RepID=A0A0A2E7R0_9PORP|nr:hypothetical protein HQ47_08440 [Porphyromonas macacae]